MFLLMSIFFLSLILTWGVRRHALRKEILDIPNHRSSHVLPTPRGGGLSFVFCFLLSLVGLMFKGMLDVSLFSSFMIAGLLVAGLGWFDDLYGVPSHWRLPGHFLAAAVMIYGVQGLPDLQILTWTLPAGTVLNALTLIYLAWMVNLYNFMDGIDGIASIEVISVCLGAAALYWFAGTPELMILPLLLAASVGGFLCWNFPPARIFMGDIGSGFLGLMLGVFSMQAARVDPNFWWSWLILLGVFIVDASFTLVRRAYRRCKLDDAHHSHAYQQAARFFGGHRPVTLVVLLINLCWLMPLAIEVGLGYLAHWKGLLLAYAPLILLAIKFKAGSSEQDSIELRRMSKTRSV